MHRQVATCSYTAATCNYTETELAIQNRSCYLQGYRQNCSLQRTDGTGVDNAGTIIAQTEKPRAPCSHTDKPRAPSHRHDHEPSLEAGGVSWEQSATTTHRQTSSQSIAASQRHIFNSHNDATESHNSTACNNGHNINTLIQRLDIESLHRLTAHATDYNAHRDMYTSCLLPTNTRRAATGHQLIYTHTTIHSKHRASYQIDCSGHANNTYI